MARSAGGIGASRFCFVTFLLQAIDKEGVYQAANYSKNEVYSDAASKMRETNITSDGVMRYIINNSNLNTLGHVTWQQFTTMFPDLDSMTEYFTSSSVPVELTNGVLIP